MPAPEIVGRAYGYRQMFWQYRLYSNKNQPVRWRATLAGCTVTVHQHLDGTISLRYGPHGVGRYTAEGGPWTDGHRQQAVEKPRRGKVERQTFPPRLEIPHTTRDSHFPTATTAAGGD